MIDHKRFKAFLRFSAPVAPGAAPRLTALEAACMGTAEATLELAVPRGDGEGKRSFKFLSAEREVVEVEVVILDGEDFKGDAGDVEDGVAEDLGAGVLNVAGTSEVEGFAVDDLECVGGSSSVDEGVLNSGGRVFGVACTLVMSFAREK